MGAFEGSVALVTGAASGIGRATARRLGSEGAALVLVDLDGARLEAAADELGAIALEGDVSDAKDWERVVGALARTRLPLALAHLNAGVATFERDLAALSVETYRRVMQVNVDGVVLGLRALLPLLEADGGGAAVVTASLAGLVAFPPDPVYAASKHAVIGLVRALAPTLERRGVRLNAVCPGFVDTPLLGDEARRAAEEAGFPLLDPEEVAAAVCELGASGAAGQAVVCQPGAAPIAYRFPGVPGPGGEHAGRRPPAALGG
jgi:NAD(P)-dependent dehydrogenase (short-subunit alcohol dehydrogenase family)